ncbi:hypothetical protein HOY80DRAFT_1134285 [Tuber brumale]|nr:hypothetical protein HOY80DRAFT_1134285 [Tuber brumale]
MSTDFKEVPMGMSDLRLEMGLLLEERNHGALRSGKIANHLVANWINENHEILENDDIRFEYNYLSQTVQIQTMALPIHESLHIYFGREVILALAEKFGRRQAGNMVTVAGSGTTFSGFTGDGLGTSRKIPDCYIQLRGGRFPTVVCEVGWVESFEDLVQDARLWLLHTNGETKIVIVLAFAEEKPKTEAVSGRLHPEPITPTTANDDGVTLSSTSNYQEISYTTTSNHEASVPQITSDEATTPPTTGNEATTPPTTGNGSEESLIKSIDGGTDLNDLAEQLFALNEQGKLQHPLLAKVHASLHIFKASKEGDDIVESFSANLLPKQPADTAAPKEFGITLHDMLGKLVPAGHDPEQEITFPLGDLKEVIEDSIPRTARLRASDRAIKLLKDTVGLDEEPTFAQRKRRRLDPFGLWK